MTPTFKKGDRVRGRVVYANMVETADADGMVEGYVTQDCDGWHMKIIEIDISLGPTPKPVYVYFPPEKL